MTAGDLEALLACWEAHDVDGALRYFNDDASYQEAGHGAIVGRDAIATHWRAFFDSPVRWRITPQSITESPETLTLTYLWEMETASGWTAHAGRAVAQICDGKISSWREYR